MQIDRARRPGTFVLTGSQKLTLMNGVSESLAGRAAVMELEAFSAAEIRSLPHARARLDDVPAVLERGFMPALWADPDLPGDEFWRSYVATYLERDVRQLVDVRDLRNFERFLRLAAVRSAQMLNRTDLARDVGISTKTLSTWLAALEATNQIVLLAPFFANIGKRLVKSPKLFLTDPGLLAFLLGVDAATLAASPLVGPIWETAVFAEIRKTLGAKGARGEVYFYRDHDGAEVDFIVTKDRHLDLIECKWTELPSDREGVALDVAAERLRPDRSHSVRNRVIACRTASPFPLTHTASAVHGLALADHLA